MRRSAWTLLFSAMVSGAVAQVPEVDLNGIDAELRKHLVEPLHLKCVSQDYEGPLETARYVNRCSQPLHLYHRIRQHGRCEGDGAS